MEDAARDADNAFILADPDAEFDGRVLSVPTHIGRETKEHCDLLPGKVSCSCIVLKIEQKMPEVQGQRITGGFILITGIDGIRYAIRPQSVGIIHDSDECHDETIVQLHGGHVVRVHSPLEEVLAWFC